MGKPHALALALVLVVVAGCASGGDDERAPSKRERKRAATGAPVRRWVRDGLGSDILPMGRLVTADGARVYVASGFGEVGGARIVTALDRQTGDTLWTATRGGPVFVHGLAGDVLVVGEQANFVAGLDTATGVERWTLDLQGEGLGGYGATVGVIANGLMALGLSARQEGDTRPPIVLGLDPANGGLRWRTPLVAGTDLNFGQPTVTDDAAVFMATPSHPGSAPTNLAHAINLSGGALRWSVELGGGQGFHVSGPVPSSGGVHLPAAGAVLTVDPATGATRWRRDSSPLPALARIDDRLWILEPNRIVIADPASGTELSASPTRQPLLGPSALIPAPQADIVLTADQRHGAGVEPERASTQWLLNWPATLFDVPVVSHELLVITTSDRAVTTYQLPR